MQTNTSRATRSLKMGRRNSRRDNNFTFSHVMLEKRKADALGILGTKWKTLQAVVGANVVE